MSAPSTELPSRPSQQSKSEVGSEPEIVEHEHEHEQQQQVHADKESSPEGKPHAIDTETEEKPPSHSKPEAKENEGANAQPVSPSQAIDIDVEQGPTSHTDITVVPGQQVRLIVSPTDNSKKPKVEHPQAQIQKLWSQFEPEYQGGITQILPGALATPTGHDSAASNVTDSYKRAKERCIKDVKRIIRECRALNRRYTDSHFDLERDLRVTRSQNCLYGLTPPPDVDYRPLGVKRVTEIFEHPQFFKDGAGYDDILQGKNGDCWFVAALSAITSNQQLVRDVCVIQDQEAGVYGFVFYRDGEWTPCIIDDKLYTRAPAWEENPETVVNRYEVSHKDQEKLYNKLFQTGSSTLYFAACRDENETWVPLLEKAFAKAHGDYGALRGGRTGEALEDLTGGVTTEIYTSNILNKDRFWKENLSRAGKDLLFSCACAFWVSWANDGSEETQNILDSRRKGVLDGHAYAVLDTYEGFGQRLVKVRNPWGETEWTGAWSDGSKEWTAVWFQRLNHKFGDDGVFWISYDDLLSKYKYMDRTRVFGPEWYVAQRWTQVQVPWSIRDYQQTKFSIDLPAPSEVVIVLSQLDARYFKGLEGEYIFELQFRLQKDDEDEDEYIARSKIDYSTERSTNIELELEAGKYTVYIKIEAYKTDRDSVDTVIKNNIGQRAKITQIATQYDLAHAKGLEPKNEKDKEDATTGTPNQTLCQNCKACEDKKSSENNSNDEPGKIKRTNTDVEPAATNGDTLAGSRRGDGSQKAPSNAGSDEPKSVIDHDDDESVVSDQSGRSYHSGNSSQEIVKPEPWNACCTVGLRVYSKIPELKLEVVKPSDGNPPVLDGDDVLKSALDIVAAAETKASQPENRAA